MNTLAYFIKIKADATTSLLPANEAWNADRHRGQSASTH